MLNLIRNENVKIYRRIRTWIFAALVLLAVIAAAAIMVHEQHSLAAVNTVQWQQQLQQENDNLRRVLQDPHTTLPQASRNRMLAQLNVNEYRLEHNVPPNPPAAWQFTDNASALLVLVTLFVAVVAADALAGEFASGTIKLLLVRPYSRTKILLAKYTSVLIFAFGLSVGLAITAWIAGGITFGFGGIAAPYVYADTHGAVHAMPISVHVLATYALKCVNLVMIATISFMISAIFRSSSLAIAISILLLFIGNTVVQLLSSYSWDKYILFANTDLTQYLNGTPVVQGMTLPFSIAMLIIYFILFHFVAWLAFTRRDVLAN